MARKANFVKRGVQVALGFSARNNGVLEVGRGPAMRNGGFLDIQLKECSCADFFKFLSVLAEPVFSLLSIKLARKMHVNEDHVQEVLIDCVADVGPPQENLSLLCLHSYRQAIATTSMTMELVGTYDSTVAPPLKDFLEFVTEEIASGILDRFSFRLAWELGIAGFEVRRAFNALCWEYGIKNQPKSSC